MIAASSQSRIHGVIKTGHNDRFTVRILILNGGPSNYGSYQSFVCRLSFFIVTFQKFR